MRILSFITAAEPVDAIFTRLGLPTTAPPLSPARGPPQHDLAFDADPGFDLDQTPDDDLTEPEPVAWVEKTPGHLWFIDRIEASAAQAVHFVHVLRRGPDVVTAALKANSHGGAKAPTFEDRARRWIRRARLRRGFVGRRAIIAR
jgi:hypothetical protein